MIDLTDDVKEHRSVEKPHGQSRTQRNKLRCLVHVARAAPASFDATSS